MISEVRAGLAHGRRGAEDAANRAFVFGNTPVWQICEPHQHGSEKGSGELRTDVSGHQCPLEFADGGETKRYGGIQMRAADCAHGIGTDHHGEAPSGGDDDPPAAIAFGLFEQDIRDHSIAEEDEQHRSD
jgi:hypothetical protein